MTDSTDDVDYGWLVEDIKLTKCKPRRRKMITENINLTHGIVDRDHVVYRNSDGKEIVAGNTTLEKCIAWEKKMGKSILWYEVNHNERVNLG